MLRAAVGIVWILFWIYWIVAAVNAKTSVRSRRGFPLGGVSVVAVILVVRVVRPPGSAVTNLPLAAIGAAVFIVGIALSIWARIELGRNWGMPMTERAEPELVTAGPYHLVRHPIYSGLLLALVGTALATNLLGLIVVAVLSVYFYYSASVEEKNLVLAFPTAYPAYQARTRMLIPFVL
jgi:protein-S-isoprenylcysteine O-methyltransferase Ste14